MTAPGGADVVLEGATSPDDGSTILGVIRRTWPLYGIQRSYERELAGEVNIPDEFFVYRSRPAFISWRLQGAVPENEDTMIGVIIEPERITFTVAEGDSETRRIVAGVVEVLSSERGLQPPNDKTQAAMSEARHGQLRSAENVPTLLAELNAPSTWGSSMKYRYVMSGCALVGIVCLTLSRVWVAVGTVQAVFLYSFLRAVRDQRLQSGTR